MKALSSPKNRRGLVVPLVAVLLPVILLLVGFSVDLAHMQKTRAELRLATDSAARAAASTLARTDSAAEARAAATQVAAANLIGGRGLRLNPADIEFGRTVSQGDRSAFQLGATPFNAVRVAGLRTAGSASGSVPLYFGRMMGRANFEPRFTAVAGFVNIDICLVLDRSTSMKVDADSSESGLYLSDPRFPVPAGPGSRWSSLDSAVNTFLGLLRDTRAEERVAIASYATDVTGAPIFATIPPYYTTEEATLDCSLTSDMAQAEAALSALTSSLWNGNTYIESGMRLGMAELLDRGRSTSDLKMIVMTDGYQNVGEARNAARDAAAAGIQVHTVTFGDFADQVVMADVAGIGGGSFQHAPTTSALVEAFRVLAGTVARLTE